MSIPDPFKMPHFQCYLSARQNAQVEEKVPKVLTEQVTSARRPKRSQRFKMPKKSDAELDWDID